MSDKHDDNADDPDNSEGQNLHTNTGNEAGNEPARPSPGRMLKELREAKGYSREKVAASLYITVHYVTALEEDDYAKLPGLTFVKGYFRTYANFLRADVDSVLDCYQQYIDSLGGKQEVSFKMDHIRERKDPAEKLGIALAIVVVLILLGAAVWWLGQ